MTRALLTNFANKNENDYDEHLSTILFLYHITFKLAIGYTPNLNWCMVASIDANRIYFAFT
jgi:hypothetical protein